MGRRSQGVSQKPESVTGLRPDSGEVSCTMTQPPSDCSEGSLIPSIFFRPFGREIKGSWVAALRGKNSKRVRKDWTHESQCQDGPGGGSDQIAKLDPTSLKIKKDSGCKSQRAKVKKV